MNNKKALRLSIPFMMAFLLISSIACFAQEEKKIVAEAEEEGHNKLSFVLSHTHIFKGRDASGHKKWLNVPSVALDYDYRINAKWAVGLHTDFITENYVAESHSGEEEIIEREKPIAPALMVSYKATRHSSFLLGAGVEFASSENLFLNRLGYEWGTHINSKWELSGIASYDIRWNAYDTFSFGIGISYLF